MRMYYKIKKYNNLIKIFLPNDLVIRFFMITFNLVFSEKSEILHCTNLFLT